MPRTAVPGQSRTTAAAIVPPHVLGCARTGGPPGAHELPECLHGVEEAVRAGAGEGDAVRAHGQLVSPGGQGVAVARAHGLRPRVHDQGARPGGVRDPAGPGLPQQLAQGVHCVRVRPGVRDQGDLVRHGDRGAVRAQRLGARPDGEVRSGGVGGRGRRCRARGRGSRRRGGRGRQAPGDDGDREGRGPLPTPQSHRPPPDASDRHDEPTTRPVNVSTRVAVVGEMPESGVCGGEWNVSRSTMLGPGCLPSRRLGRAAMTR